MSSIINKILFRDKMKNYILFLTLSVFSFFEFIFIIIFNHYDNDIDNIIFELTKYIIVLTILLFVFLVVYINMFIIEDSQKQMAILMMSGESSFSITKKVMKTYLTILFLASVLGSILGYIFMKYILNNSSYMNIEYNQSLKYTIVLFLIKAVYIFMINIGKIRDIRYNLIDYINHISKKEIKVGYFSSFIVEEEKKRFPYIKYTIVCLLLMMFFGALQMIIFQKINNIEFFIGLVGIIISFLLIMKVFIPLLFDLIHKYLLRSKIWLISFYDFISLYSFIYPIMSINTLFLPMIVYFMVNIHSTQIVIYILCYLVVHITCMLCCFFRYYVYFNSKNKQIMILKSIGYTFDDIQNVQHKELILFFINIAVFPLILIIFMIIKANMINNYKIILLIIYILPFYLLYFINKWLIYHKIKEVAYCANKSNRS